MRVDAVPLVRRRREYLLLVYLILPTPHPSPSVSRHNATNANAISPNYTDPAVYAEAGTSSQPTQRAASLLEAAPGSSQQQSAQLVPPAVGGEDTNHDGGCNTGEQGEQIGGGDEDEDGDEGDSRTLSNISCSEAEQRSDTGSYFPTTASTGSGGGYCVSDEGGVTWNAGTVCAKGV